MKPYDRAVLNCAKNKMLMEMLPQYKKDLYIEIEQSKKNWGITDEEINEVMSQLDPPSVIREREI